MAARRRAWTPSPKTSWRLRSSSVSMKSDMIVFLFRKSRRRAASALRRRWTRRGASDLRLAAVDEELGAGDETGIVGREEGDRLGDLVRIGDTADRHLARHVVEKALLLGGVGTGEADEARSLHGARAHDVDPDAALLEVERPTARQIAY